jgi:chromosome segregation ATPase
VSTAQQQYDEAKISLEEMRGDYSNERSVLMSMEEESHRFDQRLRSLETHVEKCRKSIVDVRDECEMARADYLAAKQVFFFFLFFFLVRCIYMLYVCLFSVS